MAFEKGKSGNPGGRPKENAEVKRLAREQGVASIEKLVALRDSQDERISLAAAQALLDRGFGKPAQVLVGDDEHDPITINGLAVLWGNASSPPAEEA